MEPKVRSPTFSSCSYSSCIGISVSHDKTKQKAVSIKTREKSTKQTSNILTLAHCNNYYLGTYKVRSLFMDIVVMFPQISSILKWKDARYFKKGITFKRMLSYSNYFGFADQLWHHGAQCGFSKLWYHVWSALLLSTTPPYFVYICLCVIPFSIYFEKDEHKVN